MIELELTFSEISSEVDPFLINLSRSLNRFYFFFSSRRRHTRFDCDWSSDVCSSDLDVSAYIKQFTGLQYTQTDKNGIQIPGATSTYGADSKGIDFIGTLTPIEHLRSEERRVGKECRSRWSPYH